MVAGALGGDGCSLPVFLQSPLILLLLSQQIPKAAMALRILRVETDGFGQRLSGLLVVSDFPLCLGQIEVIERLPLFQFGRLAVLGYRFTGSAESMVRPAQFEVGLRIIGADADGFLQGVYGRVAVPQFSQRGSHQAVIAGLLWRQLSGLAVLIQGLRQPALRDKRVAEFGAQSSIVRLQSDGLLETADRLLQLTQPAPRATDGTDIGRVLRLQLGSPAVIDEGFLQLAPRLLGPAKLVVSIGPSHLPLLRCKVKRLP